MQRYELSSEYASTLSLAKARNVQLIYSPCALNRDAEGAKEQNVGTKAESVL